MKSVAKLLISPNATIKQALKVIDDGASKIAFVVDPEGVLLGSISDGDIRRAILSGNDLFVTIDGIYNKSPLYCRENDSSESISELIASREVYQIPVVDKRNRIVGLVDTEPMIQPAEKDNFVVIMAGGLGTRLRPLTESRPKPMLPVGGKPILEHTINHVRKQGYSNIILSVNYRSEIIENYFRDGADFGVSIHYIHESKRMGTAGSLGLMVDALRDSFVVMNADILTNIELDKLHRFHKASNSIATMVVREYEMQIPYGVVTVESGCVASLQEKPIHSYYVNAGIYVLDVDALKYLPANDYYDMPSLLGQLIANNLAVLPYPTREYWLDIGQKSDYERANSEFNLVYGNE